MSAPTRCAQRRLQGLAANLTATEGPLRVAIDELTRVGIGARIIKSAVAASLAWIVAGFLPRESAPFVAALTAVYTVDLTILKSLTSAWQRVAGITIGIAMAFVAAEFLGVNFWSVGLVILVSMVVGLRLNLKPDGMTQVAGTAIVVLVVRSTTEERSYYALTFLADTAIGTLIGLSVNSLLVPPNYLPGVQRALNLLIGRLTNVMEQLATMVVDGISPDESTALGDAIGQIEDDLRRVEESLVQAHEALRFNVMAVRQRGQLDHFQSVEARLAGVVGSLQQLVRTLGPSVSASSMSQPEVSERLADLISAATEVLIAQGASEATASADSVAIADVHDRASLLMRAGIAIAEDQEDTDWIWLGAVLASANTLAEAAVALNNSGGSIPNVTTRPGSVAT